jgi:thioredoxin-like negative regulator of GroEL
MWDQAKTSGYIPVIGLAAVAVGVSIALIPRGQERALLLVHSGNADAGAQLLEQRIRDGDQSPAIIGALARSYAATKKYEQAIKILKRYTELRPDDDEAYATLADLYKKTGNFVQRAAMLKQSIAIRPVIERISELAALYRSQHRDDKELALLSRFKTELTMESGLVVRLAELIAAVGNRAGAIEILMRPEITSTAGRQPSEADARLLLGKLLVESGRSAEAVQLGKEWIMQWHQAWLATRLVRSIVPEAPEPYRSEIADAVVASNPEIRLYLVRILAQMGATSAARHLLETWALANASPSADEIAAFLTACREQNQEPVFWQAFGRALSDQSSDVIARYTDAIAAEFGIGALAPFWQSLPREVTEHRPLLAARLAFHEDNPELARQLLDQVQLTALSASDQRIWLDLLMATATAPEAFVVLQKLRHGGGLPSDLLLEYARLAGELGQEAEYQAVLAELPHTR